MKTDQDYRDEARIHLRSIARKMLDRKKSQNEYATYEEALTQHVPISDRKYCTSSAFRFFCIKLKDYLENDLDYERIQALQLAIDAWKHYLEMMHEKG